MGCLWLLPIKKRENISYTANIIYSVFDSLELHILLNDFTTLSHLCGAPNVHTAFYEKMDVNDNHTALTDFFFIMWIRLTDFINKRKKEWIKFKTCPSHHRDKHQQLAVSWSRIISLSICQKKKHSTTLTFGIKCFSSAAMTSTKVVPCFGKV